MDLRPRGNSARCRSAHPRNASAAASMPRSHAAISGAASSCNFSTAASSRATSARRRFAFRANSCVSCSASIQVAITVGSSFILISVLALNVVMVFCALAFWFVIVV